MDDESAMDLEHGHPQKGAEIDLAHEADFALGELRVSPSAREVRLSHGQAVIEPRVMQVLVCLAQAQGMVVSRDDLIRCCWGGRIVGEDAINRTVAHLRKLAEMLAEMNGGMPPFTIETIPRVGYRLKTISPAAPPVSGGDEDAAPPISTMRQSRWRALTGWRGALSLLAVLPIAAGMWLFQPRQIWQIEESRPFLITLPVAGHPAFSPSGSMIAYAAGADFTVRKIFVRSVDGGDPIQLTSGPDDDISPSWSSDGVHVAYMTIPKGEPCRIMVTAVPAGVARAVGRCNGKGIQTLSWRPYSSSLYYSDRMSGQEGMGAIFRLDIDTGKAGPVTSGTRGYEKEPKVSPDGKWLAYLSIATPSAALRIRNLDSGEERVLGSDPDFASDAWTSDSRTVLAASIKELGSSIRAFPIDGANPNLIYASSVAMIRLAANPKGQLAVATCKNRGNLARASSQKRAEPDFIDPSTEDAYSPAFSADGTLAFLSDHSGEAAVWFMKPGGKPALILAAGNVHLDKLTWSPDGKRLAFAETRGSATTIRVITLEGAAVSAFATASVGDGFPTWTPDGKSLVLFDADTHRAFRVELSNPSHRTPVAAPHWYGVTIRKDGVFATRADRSGLWQIDRGIRQISADYPSTQFYWRQIGFSGSAALIPSFDQANPRILLQPLGGGHPAWTAYAPAAMWDDGLAANPLNGEIVYAATINFNCGIDLLQLARR